jgi:hypothetical protein
MATHFSPAARRDQRPRRRPAGLALVLTVLALPLPALADWPVQQTAALEQQEAQGLARLSTPERRRYFEARRELERRGADQRLAELRQLEDCLERTRLRAGAETCLSWARQRREQQRQRGQADLAFLRQRFGLPAMPGVAPTQARPSWLAPQPRQPQLQPGHQSRYPAAPSYGWY